MRFRIRRRADTDTEVRSGAEAIERVKPWPGASNVGREFTLESREREGG